MKKQKKKVSSIKKKEPAKQDTSVTFKAFFSRCVNVGRCKASEEQQINIFFKRNGLKDKEDSNTYQQMLEKY